MPGNRMLFGSLFVLTAAFFFFEFSSIDLWVQELFYDDTAQIWLIDRTDPVLRLIFYDGVKVVLGIMIAGVMAVLLLFGKHHIVRHYKRGLMVVLLSMILVPLSVSGLKALTNVPCPRNIMDFNGNIPYVKVLERYPKDYKQQHRCRCYPAGHASGGFALLSLWFLFKSRKNRFRALVAALSIGWSMGLYKMAIGDHFLSHTVITMLLAWAMIQLIARWLDRRTDENNLKESYAA